MTTKWTTPTMIAVFVTAIMLVPIFVGSAQANHFVNDDQESAVNSEFGRSPQGTWETHKEVQKMYFTGNPGANFNDPQTATVAGCGNQPFGDLWPRFTRSDNGDGKPEEEKICAIFSPNAPDAAVGALGATDAYFQMVPAGPPGQPNLLGSLDDTETAFGADTTIFEITSRLYLGSLRGRTVVIDYHELGREVRADGSPPPGNVPTDFNFLGRGEIASYGAGTSQLPELFTSHTGRFGPNGDEALGFGAEGKTVAGGNWLGVRIYIKESDELAGLEELDPTLWATPVLFSFEGQSTLSNMDILADTARTNIWTENRFNEVEDLFPRADSVPAIERHVEINVVHANTYNQEVLHPQRFRDFNIAMKIMDGDKQVVSPRTAAASSDGVQGVDMYTFNFDYPSFLPDGTYTAVVFTPMWEASHDFIIGEVDFGLRLHKDETQTHTIKAPHPDPFGTDIIVERTEYVLELVNAGLQPDTIAVSVKPIGEGWTSELTKSAVSLQPGEVEEVVLTVIPDERARAGDIKNITVEAIGTITGEFDTEVVRVILTDQDKFGVELFTEKEIVQIRPGRTVSFPVTIRNTGHELDAFALSTNNLPRGWRVQIDPKSIEVHPATKNSIGVILTAPEDAIPGADFLLRIKATSIDNSAVTTTLEMPVQVFLEQSFRFDELSAVQMVDKSDDTQFWYSNHKMRDEGKGRAIGANDNYWDSSDESRGSDVWFDQTSIYRLRLENTGDLPDTYTINSKWIKDENFATNFQDFGGCDNAVAGSTSPDGVPDGWRFGFKPAGNALGIDDVAQRSFKPLKVDVEPNSVKYVWAEMGWFVPNPDGDTQGQVKLCGWSDVQGRNSPDYCDDNTGGPNAATADCWVPGARPSDPSPNAMIELTATSKLDPTIQPKKVILHSELWCAAERVDPDCNPLSPDHGREEPYNRWVESDYRVVVDVDANEPYEQQVEEGDSAIHKLRVTSLSNEMSSILIDVPRFNKGWEYEIVTIQQTLMFGNQAEGSATPLGDGKNGFNDDPDGVFKPRESGCVKDKQKTEYRCTMGYGDEALVFLEVTPPSDAKIGDFNVQEFTVISEQSLTDDDENTQNNNPETPVEELGGIEADTVTITTEFTGAYKFELDRPYNNMPAYIGETTTFPFSIRNTGTAGDQFDIQVTDAPDGWRFGLSGDVGFTSSGVATFIAGNHNYHGFIAIEPPADLPASEFGKPFLFRLLVSSEKGGEFGVIDMFAVVEEGQDQLFFTGDPLEVFARPGDTVVAKPSVTRLKGNAGEVTFTLNTTRLPEGWIVTSEDDVSTNPQEIVAVGEFVEDGQTPPQYNASAMFAVQLPDNEIGTSRAALCFDAEANNGIKRTYCMIVNLAASQYGVFLAPGKQGDTHVVAPGGLTIFEIYLENTGLGKDFIDLSHSELPAGWDISFELASPIPLDPLERIPIVMQVRPPADLPPDVSRPVVIHAASQMDPTMTDNMELTLTTGVAKYAVQATLPDQIGVIPLEKIHTVLTVKNVGTVADRVHLQGNIPFNPDLGSGDVSEAFKLVFADNDFFLEPGEHRDVNVEFTILNRTNVAGLPYPQSGDFLQLNLTAQSMDPLFNKEPFHGYKHFQMDVLRFVMADVDGDGGPEFAVDRNEDRDRDGYESYYDPPSTAKDSRSPDLSIYLSDEAYESKMRNVIVNGQIEQQFVYVIDGDGDGRMDHFVDVDDDVFPDIYWSPDNRHIHEILLAKDVTNDGSLELFVDVDGDDRLDAFFNMVTGTFGALLQVDVDGDGFLDYIVDLNDDGRVQKNEPVLYGFKNRLLAVHEVADMDGDGLDDTVIDDDADGNPDYFVRNGETKGVPIQMRDVNGDGILDWAFDADGDGRLDSYYDPVAGESYRIDTGSAFVSSMREYWYVSVLFIVVVGLFIVLVAVTRR